MTPTSCKYCSAALMPRLGAGRKPKYCGSVCRERFCRKTKASHNVEKQCLRCRATFLGQKRAKYCSYACGGVHRHEVSGRRRKFKLYRCRECQQLFMARILGTVATGSYCSVACCNAATVRQALESAPRHECLQCAKVFIRQQDSGSKLYCSRACAFAANRESFVLRFKSVPLRKATPKHIKKARALGLPFEEINPQEVFHRDGWACGICGESVDPTIAWPHPESASLDHVVPMAKGGPHLAGNVQCAHLRCNVQKGTKIEGNHARA